MDETTEDLLKAEPSAQIAALSELIPPDRARARVLTAMGAATAKAQARQSTSIPIAVAASFAVIVVTLGLIAGYTGLFAGANRNPTSPDVTGTASMPPNAAAAEVAPYFALVQESELLERALGQLPAPRRLMRGDTASTIAALESQIALIDAELSFSAARDLESEFREALWRDRVDVMTALVQVRYAQSQAFAY